MYILHIRFYAVKVHIFQIFLNIVPTLSFLQQFEQINPIFGAFSPEIEVLWPQGALMEKIPLHLL